MSSSGYINVVEALQFNRDRPRSFANSLMRWIYMTLRPLEPNSLGTHAVRLMVDARLDQALASQDFLNPWHSVDLVNLPCVAQDHNPLQLEVREEGAMLHRPFQFKSMWTLHETYMVIVKEQWVALVPQADPTLRFVRKLKRLKIHLHSLNTQTFTNVFHNITTAFESLEVTQMDININAVMKICPQKTMQTRGIHWLCKMGRS